VFKKVLLALLLLYLTSIAQAQVITQTFVDRCTGEVKIVTANFSNGPTAIAFYSKVRTFTYQEYLSGALQAWLLETYTWWNSLSPCAPAQQQTNQAQQTVTQTTQTVSNLPKPPSTQPPTQSQSESPSSSSSSSTSTSESSSSSTGSEESSSEEGEIGGEESESEKEENSEEGEDSEESEDEKDNKKKRLPRPIIMSGDVVFLQNLRGNFDDIISIGMSQSSLMGDRTYGVSSLIWSNLNQFSVSGNTGVIKFSEKYIPKAVNSYSVGYSMMFKSHSVNISVSRIILGSKYGLVGGGVSCTSSMDNSKDNIPKGTTNSLSYNLLWTKPLTINSKWNYTPVIVVTGSPITYLTQANEFSTNLNIIMVSSNSFDFKLSPRFRANFNYTLVKGSDKNLPFLNSFVIGSKLSYTF
jgi:heterogeneous nuclear ribonucleoprotein A1/A3